MKKILSILLVLVMVLSLCACGGGEEGGKASGKETFDTLQVGYGKAKIQPDDLNLVLTGGGDPNRYITGVLDYLYLTCIAVTDTDGNSALFYTVDIQSASAHWTEPARAFISERTGIPTSHIFFGSTHTHSAPGLSNDTEAQRKYSKVFEEGLIKATDDALADRADAEIHIGTVDGIDENGKKLAFVRHYIMNDGSIFGSNFGTSTSGYSGKHPYDADIQAQLIKFVRPAEDKKDVLMVSWPCHSTFNGTTTLTNLSADWPSPTRDYIDANSDCLSAIFLSGAGNQVPRSNDNNENHMLEYREYGAALGKVIVGALDKTTKINDGTIKVTSKEYTTNSNHYTDMERLGLASDVYNYFLENGQTAGTAYAKEKGFMSPYEARAYVQRSKLPETQTLTQEALCIGDLSFIIAPYEMFSTSAMAVKAGTPFEMTFIMAYANGSEGYIPTTEGYEYNDNVGCYEAYNSPWPKGAAEELSAGYLDLLKELKG